MHEGHAPPSRQLHHRYRREAEGYRLAAAVALVLAMALPAPAAMALGQDGGAWPVTAHFGQAFAANGAPNRPGLPLHHVLTQDNGTQELSQGTTGAVSPSVASPPSAPEERPLYEGQMLRLAEVLGALSFLRSLCGASDAPQWYDKMRALIDAEANTPAERERLAGSYNRGFNGYALTYRRCNASAEAAIARFLDEGARLAATITSRFGG